MTRAVTKEITQTMALQELKDYFECPVCLSVPRRPPIWQCDQGHMICSLCRPQVRACPTCRGRYSSEQRLYFAERLLEKIPVACKYSEEGCEVELVPSQMSRHEAQLRLERHPRVHKLSLNMWWAQNNSRQSYKLQPIYYQIYAAL